MQKTTVFGMRCLGFAMGRLSG